MWDLTAGRLLQEFSAHTAAVTGLEFHPCEFLLAAAAADGTVALLDVDAAAVADTLGPDPAGVACDLLPCVRMAAEGPTSCSRPLGNCSQAADLSRPQLTSGCERRLCRGRTGVHAIAFQEGGGALLSVGPSALQAWRWEPARRAGRVAAAWGCPAAVRACGGGLLVASIQGPRLSLWSAELDVVRMRCLPQYAPP